MKIIAKISKNRFAKARKLRKKGFIAETRNLMFVSLDTTIEPPVYINGQASIDRSTIIGKYTYIQGSGRISPNVKIGRYCSIAGGVNIAPTDHPVDWLTTHPVAFDTKRYLNTIPSKQITFHDNRVTSIGNDVWIGIHSIIKKGLTIGDGAIVGSGSIVTKDVPPYAVVAGVPAKIIKFRFSEEIIRKLLEIKWWDLDEKHLIDVPWDNIAGAIAFLENIVKIKDK